MLRIVNQNGNLVVDSRLIADELEILHKNFVATVNKYKDEIESEFGCLLFETDNIKMPNGGSSERFSHYLLNEDQTEFHRGLFYRKNNQEYRSLVYIHFSYPDLLAKSS